MRHLYRWGLVLLCLSVVFFSLGVDGGCVEDVLCAASIGGGWFLSHCGIF